MSISANRSTAGHAWLWSLLPLLLAAALAIPLLGVGAFNGDEPASLIAAGMLSSGPQSLEEVWQFNENIDPHEAYGWPLLLFIWGRLVGWSEVAIRALSLFAGLLTLAWVYRTGHDLLSPKAGLFASLLLSASVFFLTYMAYARAFTLVALCTTLCIWSYWRIVLHPRPTGRGAPAGLLLGSAGLFYSHYLAVLLLPVLGLFHLLFVPKKRRCWQPVLLFGLAALLAMLQLSGFLQGLDLTLASEALLHKRALSATELVSTLVHFMSNGLLDPSPPFGRLLLIFLPLSLVLLIMLRLRAGKRDGAGWLTGFLSLTLLTLMIIINELVRLIPRTRIRYLMPLWPLTALLVGAGLTHLVGKQLRLAVILLVLWLVAGTWLTHTTDFRYELGNFFPRDINHFVPLIRDPIPGTDFLVMDYRVATTFQGWFFKTKREYIFRYKSDPYEDVRPDHADYPYLWLLYLSKDRVGFADLPHELGRVFCERVLDEWGFTLERYALHSVENCPDKPVRLAFDSDIQLTAPEITLRDGLLRLDAHFRSEDDYLLSRYSLAVHVIDESGERVAQGDTGVGPGAIAPLRSEIDISALPPGDYEVRVALYDWQTGDRLIARDLETGETSDMHMLQRFRLG